MNGQEFALIVIVLIFAFSIVRHKMGIPSRSMRQMRGEPEDTAETRRLREEVKNLKDRLHVLERIATDKETSLAREIDDLRNC